MTEPDTTRELTEELRALRAELAALNGQRFIRVNNSPLRMGLFQLYRGLAFGLGSVLGATILVSIAAYLLAQIDFIPIIGDWAAEIAREIGEGNAEGAGGHDAGQ